jgi:hypothetical protein
MLATHQDAEQRYSAFRKAALTAAMEVLEAENTNGLKLTTITSEALHETTLWQASTRRKVDWDWVEGYSAFKFRYPKRFEMAVWLSDRLIGISMGRPTYVGTALRLDIVEAAPVDLIDRPSVIETVLLGYVIYARLINAKQIRIMHPLNDQVRRYYESFGYQYSYDGDYLHKEVI